VSTFRDGLFAFGINRSQSACHSGFSTHRNGNPALAIKCATVVSNKACSPFDHLGSNPGKGAWFIERSELEWRGRLGGREDCVASEKTGLTARDDGTEPLFEGEYVEWENRPGDNVDANGKGG